MIKNKIKTRDELVSIVKEAQSKGKKVGFSSGAFDLVHGGHIDYLEKAKALCDIFIVGVNTDESIKNYKDPKRPICPCKDRTKLLAALECIDYVFNFDELNNNVNITTLKPDFYIKAGDYNISQLSSAPLVESYGGEVKLIPVVQESSTSKIIKKVVDLYGIEGAYTNDEVSKFEKGPAIFLDRDGVINEHHDFLGDPKEFVLLPKAPEGLKKLQDLGFRLVIVTNQPGIGYGLFSKDDFFSVTKRMFETLLPYGIRFSKVYYAMHNKSDNSSWRKPDAGMLLQAKKDLNIDMEKSFMIGDRTTDIECARRGGVKSILVKTGAKGEDGKCDVTPDYVANDLFDASLIIESLVSP